MRGIHSFIKKVKLRINHKPFHLFMDKIIIDDQVGENNFALGRVKTLVIVEMEHKL